MMSFIKVKASTFIVIFLLINSSLLSQEKSDVSFEYLIHEGDRNFIRVYYYIHNQSEDTIIMHRPGPIRQAPNGQLPSDNPPDFYSVHTDNMDVLCETAPLAEVRLHTKRPRDFYTIPPNGKQLIRLRVFDYLMGGICQEDLAQFTIQFQYEFDERFLSEDYFNTTIKNRSRLKPAQSQQVLAFLKNSYKKTLQAPPLTIEFDKTKRAGAYREFLLLARAKQEFGITIDKVFMPDHLHHYPAVFIPVGEDFDSLDGIQNAPALEEVYDHHSSAHTIYTKNNKISWIVASSNRRTPFVYNYERLRPMLDSLVQAFELAKVNSEKHKDLKVDGIYIATDFVNATSRHINKTLMVVFEDKDGQFSYGTFNNNKIYFRLIPLEKTEHGLQYTQRGMWNDSFLTYKTLENGDLVYISNNYLKPNVPIKYQRYFIKLK